jgi:hypothetical protein
MRQIHHRKNPQFVATSVAGPTPEELQGENGQASFVRLGTLTQRGTRGICTLYQCVRKKKMGNISKKVHKQTTKLFVVAHKAI